MSFKRRAKKRVSVGPFFIGTESRNIVVKHHAAGTSSWLPPLENWRCGGSSLPYGWEEATDKHGKTYFINHLNKTTTYSDPRKDDPLEDPPKPRTVTLSRHQEMGFGFVAGSEKPVIVRFVTEGGPSEDLLLPGDQVLEINGEDVKKAPRDHVIQLVRSCKETVTLTVTQPPLDNSARKSALLSAAKKQRLKSNPSRVRFAESVHINGAAGSAEAPNLSSSESTTPFMPNVLKVFLENGQTKSFKYDSSTTVGDVLDSLHQKLGIKCPGYFSLVVEHVKSLRRNKLTILDPAETLSRIAARPGAQHLRCLYRVTFVPRDAYALLRRDTVAFEYLYHQCCNDVVQERFSPELKSDVALRLAALHIQQHAITNGVASTKISVKTVEREFGLERFLPPSLLEGMKRKELRKLLSHLLKVQAGAAASAGQKNVPALQPKLHYLKIIGELPSYGAKCFSGCVMEANQESVILISPRFGISQITGIRNAMPEPLCDIDQITGIVVSREEDNISLKVDIALKDPDKEKLSVTLEERDAEELVQVLRGYYSLLAEKTLPLQHLKDPYSSDQAPPYHAKHRVQTSAWSYATTSSEGSSTTDDGQCEMPDRIVDLSVAPPYQKPPAGYKVPNGVIPGVAMDDNSSTTFKFQPDLDSNMNKTNSVYDNTSESGTMCLSNSPSLSAGNPQYSSNNGVPSNSCGFTATARGGACVDSGTKKVLFSLSDCGSLFEARNGGSEVIRRVAELQLQTPEQEGGVSDSETTDAESVRSDGNQYGRLKHSDSLLLLTQGQKLIGDEEDYQQQQQQQHRGSGSDSDSMSTPSHSPAHRPAAIAVNQNQNFNPSVTSVQSSIPSTDLASRNQSDSKPTTGDIKTSFSSFGLHSPDNLPMTAQVRQDDLRSLIKKLEDNSGLPYTFAEGTLYLDPDIIDLTMIPPPITPDEDGAPKLLPVPQINTPPTPFADRQTLEKELLALERNSASSSLSAGRTCDNEDVALVTSLSTDTASESSSAASTLDSRLPSAVSAGLSRTNGPGFTLAALRQLGIKLDDGEDIDSFIANLTIPPPPDGSNMQKARIAQFNAAAAEAVGSSYDLSAFIIPPPPVSSGNNRSSDIIRRLYEAKAGIIRVVGDDGICHAAETEKETDVTDVGPNTKLCSTLPSGKVASLQKRFETQKQWSTLNRGQINVTIGSVNSENSSPRSTGCGAVQMNSNVVKFGDKQLSPTDSSGYDSLRSEKSNPSCDLDVRLAQALEENDQMFKTLDSNRRIQQNQYTSHKEDSSECTSPSVSSRIKSFNSNITSTSNQRLIGLPKQQSFPVTGRSDNDCLPPSPPPRVPVTSSASLKSPISPPPLSASASYRINREQSSSSSSNTLSKSASHGDIAANASTSPNGRSNSSNGSASSEDLRSSRALNASPSKQSVRSSNDSLTSSSSLVTVKSASLKSLDDEPPPELPPRSTASRPSASKPPLPRSASQDNPRQQSLSSKGVRSPSPRRRLLHISSGSPTKSENDTQPPLKDDQTPPALPSRSARPAPPRPGQLTCASNGSPSRPLPTPQVPSYKPPAPPPLTSPVSPTAMSSSLSSGDRNSPTKLSPFINRPLPPIVSPNRCANGSSNRVSSGTVSKPETLALKNGMNETNGPLQTSSPKLSPKSKITNGKLVSNSNDLDDSLDSGSFDQDSLDESEDIEAMAPASREAFKQVTSVVFSSIKSLTKLAAICAEAQKTGNIQKNEAKFQAAKDTLTSESRQFVTASKLFVKSATESEETLLQCLSNCLTLLQKMVEVTQQVVQHTATPLQTQNVVVKVRDVSSTYHTTVRAALAASGRGLDHPSMNSLMTHATNLAGVLTALMRTLRVFSPS
ncbi:FERM N-terminal [Trinorchestia longiramus]|nr:FERM N-terminal [Trinorchestia longiramus]